MWISCFAIFLLFNTLAYVNGDCDSLNSTLLIRHTISLMVLEGNWNDNLIRIRPIVDYDYKDQQWMFQPSKRIGLYNIVNVGRNGTALDLDPNYDSATDSFNATQNALTDDLTQQWYIHSDGTIVNGAAIDHILKIKDPDFEAFDYLIVGPRTTDYTGVFLFDTSN